MARLYADENVPAQVMESLRRLGHDVLSAHEAGNANRGVPDPEVLAFAFSTGRILLTLNRRDFIRLHNSGFPHAGIVACSFDADFARQARSIHVAIDGVEEMRSRLIRIRRQGEI